MVGLPLVLILALAYSCAGSSGSPAAHTAGSSPTGSTSPSGAITPSVMPTGSAPPVNSYPTAPVSVGGSAGPGSSSGASPGAGSGSSSATSPGAGSGTSTNAAGLGGQCVLSLVLTLDKSASNAVATYTAGEDPKFTVTAQDNGTSNCQLDVSSKGIVITITDPAANNVTVWASNICSNDSGTTDNSTDLRELGPGDSTQSVSTWLRTREGSGCPQTPTVAGPGTYLVTASAVAEGVNAASVQFALQ